jgi:hypothetical protein
MDAGFCNRREIGITQRLLCKGVVRAYGEVATNDGWRAADACDAWVWGNELGRLVSEQQKGAKLDQLATVVARRADQRTALFVACHEPYQGGDQPQVMRVVTLTRTKVSAVIRIDARNFTDYAAVSFGPQAEGAEHTLVPPVRGRHSFLPSRTTDTRGSPTTVR